ncbi:YdeI/OmpD-associated family protein [Frigidibacter sp. MR17.14]|uniref:YdeI/OmpD-associated family protein n=1 Tax=Frigidibacter sp. MR17.14 TaxID=3126509 RepID=UPI003012A384
MITEADAYFDKGCGRCARFATADCATQAWAGPLAALRALCLGAGLDETVKWGHPCYVHAGRNVAILGAFREDARLTFFEAGLMADPERVLSAQGPNSRARGTLRVTGADQVAALAPVIRAYLAEAMAHAAAGRRAPRDSAEPDLPEELGAALDDDPALAEAFAALTPGRRRSYVIALASAKASATRVRRVEGFRARILAGKGAMER